MKTQAFSPLKIAVVRPGTGSDLAPGPRCPAGLSYIFFVMGAGSAVVARGAVAAASPENASSSRRVLTQPARLFGARGSRHKAGPAAGPDLTDARSTRGTSSVR